MNSPSNPKMDSAPRVSVIVPAYNIASFIEPTLNSVLKQTFSDFELIVVDDGSTDDTVERVRRYSDPRLRIIVGAHRGPAQVRDTGFEAARGAYVGFLDSDDVWAPTNLERHLSYFAEHPEVDLTFSWSQFIDEEGRAIKLRSRRWQGPISFSQMLLAFVPVTLSSVVFRRDAVARAGGFDRQFPFLCDLDVCLRVSLLRDGNACAIPEDLLLYRRRSGQLSRNWRAMKAEWPRVLEKFLRLAPQLTSAVAARATSNTFRYYAEVAYRQGEFSDAFRLLGESFHSSPLRFLSEGGSWKLEGACLAALILPAPIHRTLERLAGFRR